MKKFIEPEMDVAKFMVEDVITTSPDISDPENGGGWG